MDIDANHSPSVCLSQPLRQGVNGPIVPAHAHSPRRVPSIGHPEAAQGPETGIMREGYGDPSPGP